MLKVMIDFFVGSWWGGVFFGDVVVQFESGLFVSS